MPACDTKQKQLDELGIDEAQARRILAEISAKRASSATPKLKSTTNAPGTRPRSLAHAPVQALDTRLTDDRWVIDGLVDVAPAAPATTHRQGVFLVDGQNRLWLAKLGRLARGGKPADSPITPIPDNAGRFPLGRAPSIAGDDAYWVTSHFLLHRSIKPPYGDVNIIAEDARVGTRASALHMNIGEQQQSWVAYIALPTAQDGPLRAKLWYGNDEHLLLTPEGASALSVQLARDGEQVWALSLEARTGMTSIHAREITPTASAPKLGEDIIAWVGGSVHSLSELHVASRDQGMLGLLPMEQDISHFGMAVLDLGGVQNREVAPVRWLSYHNGLDPAPLDTAKICGKLTALFVRPSTAEPGSPQELVLAGFHAGIPDSGLVLSRSKAIYDVSLASLEGGALLSYVADYRTWARTVRCVHR
jgi:hypothetical protein